jgi:ABC-2 type transport system permease protein
MTASSLRPPAIHPAPPAPAVRAPASRPGRLRWFLRVLAANVRRDLAESSRYRIAFLTRAAGFVLAALSLYFFSRFIGGEDNQHLRPYGGNYLAFSVVGLVATQLQHAGIATLAGRVRTAQLAGFLEAQLATPAPAWLVLAAEPVHVLLLALVRAAAYIAGAWLIFGVAFHPDLTTLALGVPLALATFGGLGLLSAAATLVVRRLNPVTTLLTGLSALLSGVLYPVSVLPAPLQQIAQLLPLTHVLELLRQGLLAGASPSAVQGPLRVLLALSVILSAAGAVAFTRALRRARIDGSLTHF